MGRSILITGACGFIGANFVKFWREKYPDDILIGFDGLTYAANPDLVRDDLDYLVVGNLIDKDDIEGVVDEYRPDACFHFAAESHVCRSIDGPDMFVYSNIVGTYNLIDAWRKIIGNKGRFIHISTDEVFGQLGKHEKPFNEASKVIPRSPYAATKACSDLLVLSYFETYGFPAIVTNCSNNFGRFQHEEKLIPATVKRFMKGEPARLYGDGSQIRDWLFVYDHCTALETLFLNGELGQRYCIGGDMNLSNYQMVDRIYEIMKRAGKTKDSFTVEFTNDRPTDDFRYAIDSSKIKSLGWEPNLKAFHSNLESTVQWHVRNFKP